MNQIATWNLFSRLVLLGWAICAAELEESLKFEPNLWIISPVNGEVRNHSSVEVKFGVDGFDVPKDGFISVILDQNAPQILKTHNGGIILWGLDDGQHLLRLSLVTLMGVPVSGTAEYFFSGLTQTHLMKKHRATAGFRVRMKDHGILLRQPSEGQSVADPSVLFNMTIWGFSVQYDGFVEVFLDDFTSGDLRGNSDAFFFTDLKNGPHTARLRLVDR
jgi:hypothetical protein